MTCYDCTKQCWINGIPCPVLKAEMHSEHDRDMVVGEQEEIEENEEE